MATKQKPLTASRPLPIQEALHVLESAEKGDFSKRITGSQAPELDVLFDKINKTMDVMGEKMQSLTKCNSDLEGSIEDIKTKERSINTERLLEEAIISSLGEGLIVIDPARKIHKINRQALKMFGYDSDRTLIDKNYQELISWTTKNAKPIPIQSDPIEEVFATGKKVSISLNNDFYCARKSGERFPVMVSASPVVVDKTTEHVVAIFHDATKEKHIDEIKSDFISIASHQLRTPLTVSSLHAEMLLGGHGGPLSAEQKTYLQEIQWYNKKMASLLNDFLIVSKIELGTFAIEAKPVDLGAIMEDVLHELETQIRKKEITLFKDFGKKVPFAKTDPTLIRIVFQNIVSNAVKYTPEEGTITLRINKYPHAIRLEIQDSGCGIPHDEQSHIFSKLYRGSNVKKRDSDGSGLGLYIAKSITDKCGGKIWFSSPLAKSGGTSFYIELPFES